MNTLNEQQLVERITNGSATTEDWRLWNDLAGDNVEHWRTLALIQRDHRALDSLVQHAGAVAENITTPNSTVAAPDEAHDTGVIATLRNWSGWAVAAMILLAFITWQSGSWTEQTTEQSGGDIQQAGMINTASDALREYLQRGKDEGVVVQEMPARILLDTQQSPTGQGYEVLYIRQIVERAIVPDIYHAAGEDEQGKPIMVRFEPPRGQSM